MTLSEKCQRRVGRNRLGRIRMTYTARVRVQIGVISRQFFENWRLEEDLLLF